MPGNCDPPKEHQFSSTNQPKKRKSGPNPKTIFLKAIKENWNVFLKQMSKGNKEFWKMAVEQGYGKPKETVEQVGDNSVDVKINIVDKEEKK